MDLRQLRYFVAVAEELHFGRAALRLSISQPPLSFAIRQLEEQLGVTLLVRSNKTTALTTAGEVLYREAVKILDQAKEAGELAIRAAHGAVGRLRVGFVGSMVFRGLPEAIREFEQLNPGVDVVLHEMNTADQIDAVRGDRIDLGLIHSARLPAEVGSRQLLREPFVCCLPAGHPGTRAPEVDLGSLAGEPFVLFPRAVSPYYHDLIVALCVEAGFSPRIRHEVREWLTIVGLVGRGMGIALVPRAMIHADFGDVAYLPLTRNRILAEVLGIWSGREACAALRPFLQTLSRVTDPLAVPEGGKPPDGKR